MFRGVALCSSKIPHRTGRGRARIVAGLSLSISLHTRLPARRRGYTTRATRPLTAGVCDLSAFKSGRKPQRDHSPKRTTRLRSLGQLLLFAPAAATCGLFAALGRSSLHMFFL